MTEKSSLIVNFGGPRTLKEIEPFLISLLTDQDVVRTNMPQMVHNLLFRKIAKKRAKKVEAEYDSMGGGSPIYADTEAVAKALEKESKSPVLTFHRYLPQTHAESLQRLEASTAEQINVFPMFPQFSYATTGSCARLFQKNLSQKTLNKLSWVKSYATHPALIALFQKRIRDFLKEKELDESEVVLLFSAHGVPQKFVQGGDPYQKECEASFNLIAEGFQKATCKLSYQSKFGPGEWLQPYTTDCCQEVLDWAQGKKHVLFVPLTFTSDHIETLVEIERDYMPLVRKAGLQAHRLPAFNRGQDWIETIDLIISNFNLSTNQMLVRN